MCVAPELTGLPALLAALQKLVCSDVRACTGACKVAAEALRPFMHPLQHAEARLHMMHASLQAALQELAFQNVGCSIRACEAVAELVKRPQELRRLHLHNNMSDDAGAAAIAQARPASHAPPPCTSPCRGSERAPYSHHCSSLAGMVEVWCESPTSP